MNMCSMVKNNSVRNNKCLKLLKIYLTPNKKLTARQMLTKLKIEALLSYILLILLIVLAIECTYLFYKFHKSIHVGNVSYAKTGLTSIHCYSNHLNTILCCADRPYITINFTDHSKKSFAKFECYKFKTLG